MAHIVLHPILPLHIWTFAKSADIEFPWEKVLQLAEQQLGWQMLKQYAENTESMSEGGASSLYDKMSIDYNIIHRTAPHVFRKAVWLQAIQLLLHCLWWLTRRTTGKLLSAWNRDLFMQTLTRASFHRSSVALTCMFSIYPPVVSFRCVATTMDSDHSQWKQG